jgi:outer membrane protein assembly factor BamB
MDLIHANTVEWLNKEHLFDRSSIYGPGNVLVTSRRQNVTAIINWDSNLVLWAWGQGEILSPHDATLLDNGNILLLDNGDKGHRPFSRVLEIDPLTDKIVWEYRAENPEDFFTASRGAIQRLPNGNTLITNSNSGQVFEVTHEGEIVWEFLNPHLTPTLHRATMRRLERYPKDYVEAILARHPSDN